MLDMPLTAKWQMMTGLRLESSEQVVTTYDPFSPVLVPIKADLTTLDILPGANLTYRLTERMNLKDGCFTYSHTTRLSRTGTL